MERIVCDQVFSHLTVDNLLSSHQSGFRQLHWTVTALLRLPATGLLKYMGGVNAVVFLDLQKVFDKVNHVSCTDERSENTPGQHGDLLQLRFIEPMRALACENIRFSSLFATGDVSRGETSPAAKSEEKRMFSQAMRAHLITIYGKRKGRP